MGGWQKNHPQSTSKTATCGHTNANLPSLGSHRHMAKASTGWQVLSQEIQNHTKDSKDAKDPRNMYFGFGFGFSWVSTLISRFLNSNAFYLACSRLLFFLLVHGPWSLVLGPWSLVLVPCSLDLSPLHPHLDFPPICGQDPFIIYYDTDHTWDDRVGSFPFGFLRHF